MKPDALKMKLAFPFDKKDVHYDASKKEISLSVEKFDALVKFIQELVDRVETAEENAGVSRYRMKEAQATAGVLAAAFEQVKGDLREWLGASHNIRELAIRTGIPYATCYRIVKERMENDESVDSGDLQKIASVLNEDLRKSQAELGDDIVVLPRPGETLHEEDIYRPEIEQYLSAEGFGMSDSEMRKKVKEGKFVLKLVDIATGKAQPIKVQSVRLEPAARAGRNLYKVTGKLDFSKAPKKGLAVRDLNKAKS